MKLLLRRVLRLFATRVKWSNMYTQLANIRVCFDFKGATDDQILMLWINHMTLTTVLLREMEARGMDAEAILEETKRQEANGAFDNAGLDATKGG